ncbi:MAG: P-type conjugative transfer protein TrbG [Proteobacteria bacterium]|nr:P-type conjugative transfer protein TrbG [Pseudomonadota bacterium]MBU1541471.1 P-type conjugative transfer protein TrbG [Pseudomonadota bacterium]MBU2431854.1 P-type conjugative transfer protein TrbG [Pseudomonadota bacterium]MBU2480307.1 P-type conjugative transfer protein TrbG [Pseudomonadota bacterium]
MKIKITLFVGMILFCVTFTTAWAISPELQKKAALQLAEEWQNKRIKPILSPDGKIVYLYGATAVTVKTKIYHSTDIELQAGETIEGLNAGDTVRWLLEPAYHGSGKNKTLHIFVKPTDVNLKTNLTILTNIRAYRFNLESSKKEHMSIVGFEYPKHYQDVVATLKVQDQIEKAQEKKRTLPSVDNHQKRLSIASLDFNYKIDGDTPAWRPIRVYNDGEKTIIEMPEKAKYTTVPVLSVMDENQGKAIVNYRLLDNKFVVDMLFSNAILVSGVGNNQTIVNITHKEKGNEIY